MKESGLLPDVATYDALLLGLSKTKEVDDACGLLKELIEQGCAFDSLKFDECLEILTSWGNVDEANELIQFANSKGLRTRS